MAARLGGAILLVGLLALIVRWPVPVDPTPLRDAMASAGLGRFLLLASPCLLLVAGLLVRRLGPAGVPRSRRTLGLGATALYLLGTVGIARVALSQGAAPYAVPVVLLALPVGLRATLRSGTVTILGAAGLIWLCVAGDPLPWVGVPAPAGPASLSTGLAAVAAAGGMAGFLVALGTHRRSGLLVAGATAGVGMGLAYLGWALHVSGPSPRELLGALGRLDPNLWRSPAVQRALPGAGLAVVNGVATGLVLYHALPLVTYVTRRPLEIELSDYLALDHPLLVELRKEAPGSYHHSLNVGELSAAAAEAIGENPVLCRAASLFHDVGKMHAPPYFTENCKDEESPHLDLPPRESARVIIDHVEKGEEKARAHALPPRFIDIIREHHGTTRVEYFYRRARDRERDGGPPVDETTFRYPGPRPRTPAAALVMLADGVEAITRSLPEPTPEALVQAVDRIFRNKVNDRQLVASGLDFADLERARSAFIATLEELHHKRISYPSKSDTDEIARRDVEVRR